MVIIYSLFRVFMVIRFYRINPLQGLIFKRIWQFEQLVYYRVDEIHYFALITQLSAV